MEKKFRILAIIAALAASAFILTSSNDPLPIPEPLSSDLENNSVQIIATNLEKPRSIAIHENTIFVTEQEGRIRIIQDNVLLDEPLITLRPAKVFDGGLLGIETHPNFSENHLLYVYLTYEEDGQLWNKILKISESDNKFENVETIFDKIPGSQFTNGGFLKFGPDKKLYVGTGTISDSSHLPLDVNSLSGKILRLNDDGSIPTDNPFPNSPVYSLGHRNPQGMTWDKNGNMYIVELGPEKNDEINLIIPGKNYGWPNQQCSGISEFEDAIICYDPAIEPGGILFYYGDKVDVEHHLIMASLRASNLYQLSLDDGLKSQKSILSGIGRIRDLAEGPDGSIYVITSNTDGKGFPDSTDDKLLRIVR